MPPSNRPPSRPRPWDQGTAGEAASFGGWLRRQREARQIGLREIADYTKISLRYLEALESDRFDILPAPVFAKGFLREYARYVGLNPDDVVNSYLSAQQEADELATEPEEGHSEGGERSRWASPLLLILAVALVMAAVALLAFYAERARRSRVNENPPPIAAPPPSAAIATESAAARPVPAAAAPLEVILDFTDECWVEAIVDGQRRVSELRVQGESLQFEAEENVLLTLGNPRGVRIEVNGRPMPVPGRPGQVSRLEVDLETARALAGDGGEG